MDENDVSDSRVRYTDHQLQKLEEIFSEHAFINGDQAAQLSRELGISLKQTRVRIHVARILSMCPNRVWTSRL